MSWLDSVRFPLENDFQLLVFERQACWPLLTSLMSAFEQFHRFPGFNKVSRLQEKIIQVNGQFQKTSQLRREVMNASWWREMLFGTAVQRKQFMTLRTRYAASLRALHRQFSQLRQLYFSYYVDRQKAGMNQDGNRQLLAIFPRGPLHDYYQAHYFTTTPVEALKAQALMKRALSGRYPHDYQLEQIYVRGLYYATLSETSTHQNQRYLTSAKQCLWDAAQEQYAPAMWTCGHYFQDDQVIPTPSGPLNAKLLMWAQAAQENFIPAIADLAESYLKDLKTPRQNPRMPTYQYIFSHLLSQEIFFQKVSLAAFAHDSGIARALLTNLNVYLHDSQGARPLPVLQLMKLQRHADRWMTRMQDQNYLEATVTNHLVHSRVSLESRFDPHVEQRWSSCMPGARPWRTWRFSQLRVIEKLVNAYAGIRRRSCYRERLLTVNFIQDMLRRSLAGEQNSLTNVRTLLKLKSQLDEETQLLRRLPVAKSQLQTRVKYQPFSRYVMRPLLKS